MKYIRYLACQRLLKLYSYNFHSVLKLSFLLQVWPIMIHDDEVMSGQGIVFENFRNSIQNNYSCKGTVHIVLTNQV